MSILKGILGGFAITGQMGRSSSSFSSKLKLCARVCARLTPSLKTSQNRFVTTSTKNELYKGCKREEAPKSESMSSEGPGQSFTTPTKNNVYGPPIPTKKIVRVHGALAQVQNELYGMQDPSTQEITTSVRKVFNFSA